MEEMLYTYAFDGSGVALRTKVEILATGSNAAVVRFPDYTPPPDPRTRTDLGNGTWRLLSPSFTPIGSYAPLASFNFLD